MNKFKSWLTAKVLLITIAIVWSGMWFLHLDICGVTVYVGEVQAVITLLGLTNSSHLKRLSKQFWLVQDQMVNVIFLGNAGVAVSSKVGTLTLMGSKTAGYMAVVIDFLFYIATGDKNHCVENIQHDEEHNIWGK